jgi:hypothetical protein
MGGKPGFVTIRNPVLLRRSSVKAVLPVKNNEHDSEQFPGWHRISEAHAQQAERFL